MSEQASVQTQTAAKPTITPVTSGLLQRQCACGQHTGSGGECEECKKKRPGTLQRAAVDSSVVPEVPPIVHEVLHSPGQPLDAKTRVFMEPRFGHDFSSVRVHTDDKAEESARAVNALAYTVGRDVVFGADQYSPNTAQGQRLMAHELVHTIQSEASSTSGQLKIGDPHSSHEQQAESATHSILAARAVRSTSSTVDTLQRMTRDEALALAMSLDTRYPNWLGRLPPCPCTFAATNDRLMWNHSTLNDLTLPWFHQGAVTQVRSAHGYQSVPGTSHGQQCCYDSEGNLITEGAGAGTPDLWSPITNFQEHQDNDVATFNQLGWRIYTQYWRPNQGVGCRPNAGGGRRISSGRYRIVGAFDETDLFLFSIVWRQVSASENVQVTATGREQGDLVGGRGHYSRVEVVPANQAATNLFGGNQPRYLPDYLLQPL